MYHSLRLLMPFERVNEVNAVFLRKTISILQHSLIKAIDYKKGKRFDMALFHSLSQKIQSFLFQNTSFTPFIVRQSLDKLQVEPIMRRVDLLKLRHGKPIRTVPR